jgi:thymidylate synthase
MQQYKDLLTRVLSDGTQQSNRTGVDTIFISGDMMKFDLSQGFPVMTLRQAAWKSAIGEMIGFIGGKTNAADFRALKCKFWDKNANENGIDPAGNIVPNVWLTNPHRKGENDLGEIYGHCWRRWLKEDGTYHDQLFDAINQIVNNPTSRRIIVNSWRPDRFDRMALPPCHVMFQFLVNVERNELNMTMYIRSNDLFLGAPANIIEYAFLLEVVAHATGLKPKMFTYFVSDAHCYINSLDAVNEMLSREPRKLPKLVLNKPFIGSRNAAEIINWLEQLHPDDFELDGYDPHPAITGVPMVV